jgi:hypothetical protein
MQLPRSLAAWQTADFNTVFKDEIKQLDPTLLPLQQGLAYSSNANADSLALSILHVDDLADSIQVKAGLFYTGIVAGCSCADDPSSINEVNEYCEVRFSIDKSSGAANVVLLQE